MPHQLQLFADTFPVKLVKALPKTPDGKVTDGDYEFDTGIRLVEKLNDDMLCRILWHETGHALFEHFGLHRIAALEEYEELICSTMFQAIPYLLTHNPYLAPENVNQLREKENEKG